MTTNKDKIYAIIEENFREDYKNLLRIAEQKLGNLWGEDCVMDTYEKVLRYADKEVEVYNIKHLMRTALHNRIKDYLSDRIDSEEVEEDHLYGGSVEDKWADYGTIKGAILMIESYPEPMKTALYLHCIEGVSSHEVSRITEVNSKAVQRAAIKVRENLND